MLVCAAGLALVAGLAFIAPTLGERAAARVEESLKRLSRKPALSILLLAASAFAASLATTLYAGIPYPAEHDEFSHLLAADTFASGRVTNPTHSVWVHFESFHIIHRPSYMTKFPPGQGAILAVGQRLFGTPAAGLWLSAALLTGAVTWMMYAWLPPVWALTGGIVTLLHFAASSYWTRTYWSGAVPAAGGALMFGALRRIIEKARARDVVLFAAGLALLAHSRPYEGLVAALPAGALLVWWLLRTRKFLVRLGVPALCCSAAVLGSVGWYNHRVTGDPLRMPYQVYLDQYEAVSTISGPVSTAPQYRNRPMAAFYQKRWTEKTRPAPKRAVVRFFESNGWKARNLWTFYLGPLLTFPLFFLGGSLSDRWMRFAFGVLILELIVLLQLVWVLAHYAAPVMALIVLLVVTGLRELRRRHGAAGRFLSRGIPAAIALALLVRIGDPGSLEQYPWAARRQAIERQLENTPGRHLVLVRYSPRHIPDREWVYNRASIDAARVVWARELEPESNARLARYFADRRIWLLEADAPEPRLESFVSLPPHGSRTPGGEPASAPD